jgi:uncharacterized membrane protein
MDAVAAIISTVVVIAHRLPREQHSLFWPLFFRLDGRLGGALRR